MNRGYVKIYRCIEDNPMWLDDEPFCKRAAWIDLILQANHKDNSFILGMKKVNIKRGQKWTSASKLADRWHWGRKKVMAFLRFLQEEGQIWLEVTNKGLLITLVNYGTYQGFLKGSGTADGTADGTSKEHQTEQQMAQQMHINNNVKNDY